MSVSLCVAGWGWGNDEGGREREILYCFKVLVLRSSRDHFEFEGFLTIIDDLTFKNKSMKR